MRPWLWLPSSVAYRLTPWFLQAYSRWHSFQTLTWSPFVWRDLEFNNPLGLAGGMDKDARLVQAWWSLGPGFIEIGTVTPRPQSGNFGKRVARDIEHEALWNRLGFPSRGVDYVAARLKALYQPRFTPVFANIGKNADTPNERAHEDYIECMRKLRGLADCYVVNISSPNTEGLRELLKPDNLRGFLKPLIDENRLDTNSPPTPLVLKVSPDIDEAELKTVLDISLDLGIDGWVLTNSSAAIRSGLPFPAEGGVSGRPLAATAKRFLEVAVAHLGERRGDRLIVSAGGVLSADDVFERLQMGAQLVQVYSSLVFNGPFFLRTVADKAALRLNK